MMVDPYDISSNILKITFIAGDAHMDNTEWGLPH